MAKHQRRLRKAPKCGRGKKKVGKEEETTDKPFWAVNTNVPGGAASRSARAIGGMRTRQKNPG